MERDDTLFPIEAKKTASPSRKDARNLNAIDPVNAPDVASELSMFKREIGTGTIVCMAQGTFPVSERAWHSRLGRFSAHCSSLRARLITKHVIAHHVT